MKEVEFEIVDERYIKICGVKYSMALFQYLGFGPLGSIVEIIERTEDGIITIRRHFDKEATQKEADRYRFIRQSEAEVSLEVEPILADVWKQISLKGLDKSRMDAIIDEGIKAAKVATATQEIGHGG